MQIPYGIITDKLGAKTIVLVSCALLIIGTFLFGSAESLTQLKAGRFLVGLASAPGFICCSKVITDLFELKKQSMLMGIAMCLGCFGGILGATPTACLVNSIGWRNATYAIASFGILLIVLALLFMKNNKSEKTEARVFDGLKIILKNSKIWIVGLYGAMSYLTLSALAELWITPFIEKRFEISTAKAAVSSIFIFIGFGLGSIVSAWIAEKINSHKKTIIIFSVASIFLFWSALYSDAINFYTCLALLFAGGVCTGANILAFPIAYRYVPQEFGGTAAGFMNAIIMSSGIVFQPLLGKLLDFFRNGLVTLEGHPLYNVAMYRSAFLFFIGTTIVATVFAFCIKENAARK
jgi:MFS family permease